MRDAFDLPGQEADEAKAAELESLRSVLLQELNTVLGGVSIYDAQRFIGVPLSSDTQALLAVARHEDSRTCLILLGAILATPQLADRLLHVLKPERQTVETAPALAER